MATQTLSAMATIAALAAAPSAAAKKDSKPSFVDETLDEAIAMFIEQKQLMESAEARMKQAKDQIVTAASKLRMQACMSQRKVLASISLSAGPGRPRLTYTQTKRYSKVPEAAQAAVREAFGEEFDGFFRQTLGISLKEESAANEQVLGELIERLGPQFLAAHFSITRDLDVLEAFHNAVSTDQRIFELAKPLMDQQMIKPYEASLKVA